MNIVKKLFSRFGNLSLKQQVRVIEMKKIVLFSTQRSGSTMVCDDLAGTNVLGRPSEYFIKLIETRNELNSDEKRNELLAIVERSSTPNGISAVKVMSNQIQPIGQILLNSGAAEAKGPDFAFMNYFDGARFYRITRKDKVAQAVSRILAAETNVYHASDDSKGLEGMLGKLSKGRDETGVEYSASRIKTEIEQIRKEEHHIDNFIKKFNIPYTEIVYEEVVNNRGYIYEIAEEFDIENIVLAERRLKKIGGGVGKDWISQYKSEMKAAC